MNKIKIFITGINSFIAKNVIEQLGEKYIFVTQTHKQLDLTDAKSVELFFKKSKHFDFVIHTAVIGGSRKVANTPQIATDNLSMFFNIVRNRRFFGKMIHLGSGVEYGKEHPLKKVREEDFDKWVPQDNFGFYKYLCAKYIEETDKILNLRLFGVFGKYEDFTIRFISNAICKSILKMPITINQNVFFDYLYIDDFVGILDFFLTHTARYKSYNVGCGSSIDLLRLANKINKIATFESKIKVIHAGLANEYTCDNTRLLKELGSFKFTDFDQSLAALYEWYLNSKLKLKKEDFRDDHFS